MVMSIWFTIAPKNQNMEAPYMFSMFHTSGIDPTNGNFVFKFEESSSSDNVGGVGGWNCIPLPNKSSNKLVFEI
jgi:hypothetical protein